MNMRERLLTAMRRGEHPGGVYREYDAPPTAIHVSCHHS